MLISQVRVDLLDHVERLVPHELRDGDHIDAVQDGVRPERVPQQVRAYILRQVCLLLEPVDPAADRVHRPRYTAGVEEHVVRGRSALEGLHQSLHGLAQEHDARFAHLVRRLVLRQHPAILPHLIPRERAGLLRPAAGLPEGEEEPLEVPPALLHEDDVLLVGQRPFPGARPGALHPAQGILRNDPLFLGPRERTVHRPAGVALGRLLPAVLVHEPRDVDGLEFGHGEIPGRLRELLAVPEVVAVRLVASVDLRPGEKRLDHIRHAGGRRLRDTRPLQAQLVELVFGELLIPLTLRQAGLHAAERHHPPAGVLTEPDLVRPSHTKPPVVE
ncbi:hypothetical protein A2264_01140 [candidate division WWE3 bacterium RIFOXYA2_FULL_46_9]|uniref:Uncharacterized protein n=1 Tax=candidate division WWE3 bacterium RIFOXYA2_FULL_46_9 TaxID=1802636 RepID=A0A1F4VZF6_UNCKA|nr:MAG: hypothetical protein A2264_01140 [candidate division WWE3 bacterium RIFOXYA2_FULL_46_9]